MFRKYPFLGYVASIAVLGVYLGLIFFVATNFIGISFSAGRNSASVFPDGYGYPRSQNSGPNKILVTNNAGQSWQKPFSSYGAFSAMSCPTSSDCFVVSEGEYYLIASQDNGKTWRPAEAEINSQVIKLSCPKIDACFGLGLGARGNTFLSGGDRATDWTTLSFGQVQKDLNALSCPTPTTCYVVGGEGRILATTDGGHTWNSQASGTERSLLAISCAGAKNCTAVGRLGTLLTTNDGQTWTKDNYTYDQDFTAVSCPTTSNCTVAGGNVTNGTLVATSDGGKNWQALSYGSTGGHYALSCPSAKRCWAVGAAGLIRTTSDGGQTWQTQPSGLTRDLTDVVCPDETNCYVLASQL